MRVLLIDNYDSFSFILRDYIQQCSQDCFVVRNDEYTLSEIEAIAFDSIVISPGPKTPEFAGITMEIIRKFHTRVPILGVCLGHQALGIFFGMKLVKAIKPMHGKTSEIIISKEHLLFKGLDRKQTVMRYHSLVLMDEANENVEVIARTAQGEVMAIAHKRLPLAGVQFHPESVLTLNGLKMLQNWFRGISKKAFD
ncbi:MAG: aminodeoxychorismate/anthranilate synthase component II [Chitinophagales bacterium]|nr:aminodeoxychorismate/anthranilate synthase component II [Chitinophagales bacterium]MDW8273514.1 aminodeoxychorismate/anthranilate synthase component II [Chitinophagales bacterium]